MATDTIEIQHGTGANRLVLRDGSVATVRPATPADQPAVRRFYDDLSVESRRRRLSTKTSSLCTSVVAAHRWWRSTSIRAKRCGDRSTIEPSIRLQFWFSKPANRWWCAGRGTAWPGWIRRREPSIGGMK